MTHLARVTSSPAGVDDNLSGALQDTAIRRQDSLLGYGVFIFPDVTLQCRCLVNGAFFNAQGQGDGQCDETMDYEDDGQQMCHLQNFHRLHMMAKKSKRTLY